MPRQGDHRTQQTAAEYQNPRAHIVDEPSCWLGPCKQLRNDACRPRDRSTQQTAAEHQNPRARIVDQASCWPGLRKRLRTNTMRPWKNGTVVGDNMQQPARLQVNSASLQPSLSEVRATVSGGTLLVHHLCLYLNKTCNQVPIQPCL